MALFQYRFRDIHPHGGAPCSVPGHIGHNLATLNGAHPTVDLDLSFAEMALVQLRFGTYPLGWEVQEMTWRLNSLAIAFNPTFAIAVPLAPPNGYPQQVPFAAGAPHGPGYLRASPVALNVDATEASQISYHVGTAVGGHLATRLTHTGGPGTVWFPFHLTRAQALHGHFNFLPGDNRRPDIVLFAIEPAAAVPHPQFHNFAVWENKGHLRADGGAVVLTDALAQSLALVNCDTLPGINGHGHYVLPAVKVPEGKFASNIDYRGPAANKCFLAQVVDPPGDKSDPMTIPDSNADAFLRGYYQPFVKVIASNLEETRYNKRRFYTAYLDLGVKIGIDARIFDAYHNANNAGEFHRAVFGALSEQHEPHNVQRTPEPRFFVDTTGLSTEINCMPKGESSGLPPAPSTPDLDLTEESSPPLKRRSSLQDMADRLARMEELAPGFGRKLGEGSFDDEEKGGAHAKLGRFRRRAFAQQQDQEIDQMLQRRLLYASRAEAYCVIKGSYVPACILFEKNKSGHTSGYKDWMSDEQRRAEPERWRIDTYFGADRGASDYVSFDQFCLIESKFKKTVSRKRKQ